MKNLARISIALVVALSISLAAAGAANANDDPTVDYVEIDAARLGSTPGQVQQLFDSPGFISFQSPYGMQRKYRQAYGKKDAAIMVGYEKDDYGTWRTTSIIAHWGWTPNKAQGPATKSEYLAIKAGMTIAQVRAIIGSNGTRAQDVRSRIWVKREFVWPAPTSRNGAITVEFTVKNGRYVVSSKSGVWG